MKYNNMITTKQIISGTEEELLEFFKEKYNLIESSKESLPTITTSLPQSDLKTESAVAQPAQVENKVTTGIGNLFAGTSWGN
jgi:hypothetical protein